MADLLTKFDERLLPVFQDALSKGDFESANRLAMKLSDAFLGIEPEQGRALLWDRYFSALHSGFWSQYQSQDFEIVDYEMFAPRRNSVLLRGPKPPLHDLAAGNYVCVIGAAQLFGRFHERPLHRLIAETCALPVLNLSIGGIGPQEYLSNEFLTLAKRSRLLIVQVLSGRSVGCEEYPGTWTTVRPGESAPLPREIILKEIWERCPTEALRLVRKWSALYVGLYESLCTQVTCPKVLLWMSSRKPEDWSEEMAFQTGHFGLFPQLVSEKEVGQIRRSFDAFLHCPADAHTGLSFKSRLTDQPCPYIWPDGTLRWKDEYYPSQGAHEWAAQGLAPILADWLSHPRS